MLQFTKLQLSGFKSFIEQTELSIEPGLTGIVGPNGCGKSNLVEALRWVMGESSARQLRGGEMEDVIFNGAAGRPARNIAEVVLVVETGGGSAPPPFSDQQTLQISRRIERDKGSAYRVNGKEVRARDVQLLFADSASGARSAAMVSQGQVGTVIAAKPSERRLLLEEAAGITGLHARRHETEIRLKAAEANLERLDDVLVTVDSQLQSLKRQARQAARYRAVGEQIRKTEAALLLQRWRLATAALMMARGRLADADRAVSERTGAAAEAAVHQAEVASRLPELRRKEADAAAVLQRLQLARDGLEAEARRVEGEAAQGRTRLAEITADLLRERALADDAAAAEQRLFSESRDLHAKNGGDEAMQAAAAAALAEIATAIAACESEVTGLTERLAAAEARRSALSRRVDDLHRQWQRLNERATDIGRQRQQISTAATTGITPEAADQALGAAAEALDLARREADSAERTRAEAASAALAAMRARSAAEAALAGLDAEAKALAKVLAGTSGPLGEPIIDAVSIAAGMEHALAAALGDDLLASAGDDGPLRWRTLPPLDDAPPLPARATPLSDSVQAPPALARRLSQVGLIDDEAEGDRLLAVLRPGQRLVSRSGRSWRWDGLTTRIGTASPAAVRLAQRQRLNEIDGERTLAALAAADAACNARAADEAAKAAAERERQARAAVKAADQDYGRARALQAVCQRQAAERASRLAALAEAETAIMAELAETAGLIAAVEDERAELAPSDDGQQSLARSRAELAELRSEQRRRQATFDGLVREAEARRRRLQVIDDEMAGWRSRNESAHQRMADLERRRQELAEKLERLAAIPDSLAARHRSLLDDLEVADRERKDAADALVAAETALATADRMVRASEGALAEAREERIRAEAALAQGEQGVAECAAAIFERLELTPEQLAVSLGDDGNGEPVDLAAADQRLARLRRERDLMGPVNLRAEQEAEALAEQVQMLEVQRGDLIEAIGKLRRGIGELDREGRERLLASFAEVNRHFRELFQRLFGGGRAHLALTEPDDPLLSGVEIMACPPGKRLQSLSLLSGGEQALTALALVFAVFLTKPAPICVLDEVDAPLDDANVDRFCALLTDMAANGTRFLVITHHRMTMARMHRLFGVTMVERGVSQLVCVDLERAEALRQTA